MTVVSTKGKQVKRAMVRLCSWQQEIEKVIDGMKKFLSMMKETKLLSQMTTKPNLKSHKTKRFF